MVLHPSQSIAGAAIDQKAAAKPNYCLMDPLFRKEFNYNQADPERTWSMNVDKLQIVLSSEVSNELRAKSILTLNFV